MKIFLVSIIAVLSIQSAYAEDRHEGNHDGRDRGRYEGRHDRHHEGHYGDFGSWIGPVLLGSFIGYELARLHTVYAQPAPQPAVIVQEEVYTGPAPQPVYKEFVEYDSGCNCYMHILRQVGWH